MRSLRAACASLALLLALWLPHSPRGALSHEEPARDWCRGLQDGTYGDPLTEPACSGYFSCRGGQVASLAPCPLGQCYQEARGRCTVRSAQCKCQLAGTWAPQLEQPRHGALRGSSRVSAGSSAWRWQTGRSLRRKQEGPGNITQGLILDGLPNAAQIQALKDFRRANRDIKGAMAEWVEPRVILSPRFVCAWPGVTCGPGNSSDIVAVAVNNADFLRPLRGDPGIGQSIPPSFGALTALTLLDLSKNSLYNESRGVFSGMVGSIPEELSRCTGLRYLDLQYNSLTGPIPDGLSALTNLQFLALSYNLFDMPFPTVVTTLVALTYLRLSSVGFSGKIPASLSALSRLKYLQLKSLPLSGPIPSSLGTLASLEYLGLLDLPIRGALPESLSGLTKLTKLRLFNVNVTGPLPGAAWWARLGSLNTLDFQNTLLGDSLPQGFGEQLQYLILANSNFTGNVSKELVSSLCAPARAAPFLWLQLDGNQLSGSFPIGLRGCASLQHLQLGRNRLGGEIPPTFFQNSPLGPSLDTFNVTGNRISGQFQQDMLLDLTYLSSFDVSRNRFSGLAPTVQCTSAFVSAISMAGNFFSGDVGRVLGGLKGCANLTLDVSGNMLTGQMPMNWALNLKNFNFSGNRIGGAMPKEASCAFLQDLDGSGNRLSGPIPGEILNSKCTELKSINLAGNELSGPIPTPGANNQLNRLDLSNNRLSGQLPSLPALAQLSLLDLSNNSLTGPIPANVSALVLATSLDLSHNSLNSTVPASLGQLGRALKYLSLADNALSGPIPGELAPPYLARLLLLDLSSNYLTGPIPFGFNSLPNSSAVAGTSLRLNLSDNNLEGRVPGGESGYLASPAASIDGNKNLCGAAGYPPCPEPPPTPAYISPWAIAAITVAGVLVLALAGLLIGCCVSRGQDPWSGGVLLKFRDIELSIGDLVRATDNFSDDFRLGRGGFGTVYKVTLPDGTEVAVKRLALGSSQGDTEFKAEVQVLGRLSHRNLVTLVAAYIAAPPFKERLLVYDFLPGGSLDRLLLAQLPPDSPFRHFEVRHKVALDVARGLKYLHQDCLPGIIHRDMKPGNVLLDADLVAHVADFGMAKEADIGRTHMTDEAVFGTAGYVAPEYNSLGRLSFKSDVYAYGVTLIQLMTGRRTSDAEIADQGLLRWAQGGVGIVDPNLEVGSPLQQQLVLGCIKLGAICIAKVPVDRPSMEEVVHILGNLEEFSSTIGVE